MAPSTSPSCTTYSATDAVLLINVQNCFMVQRPVRESVPMYPLGDRQVLEAGPLSVSGSADIVDFMNDWIETTTPWGVSVIGTLDWHPPKHCSFWCAQALLVLPPDLHLAPTLRLTGPGLRSNAYANPPNIPVGSQCRWGAFHEPRSNWGPSRAVCPTDGPSQLSLGIPRGAEGNGAARSRTPRPLMRPCPFPTLHDNPLPRLGGRSADWHRSIPPIAASTRSANETLTPAPTTFNGRSTAWGARTPPASTLTSESPTRSSPSSWAPR